MNAFCEVVIGWPVCRFWYAIRINERWYQWEQFA